MIIYISRRRRRHRPPGALAAPTKPPRTTPQIEAEEDDLLDFLAGLITVDIEEAKNHDQNQ